MRKIAASVVILLVGFTWVAAEEFIGQITKVDGNKITFTKGGGFGKKKKKDPDAKPAEPMTMTVADGCKVLKGKFNFQEKKFEAGDAIEGGFKSDSFKNATVFAQLTTTDDKVTQVLVFRSQPNNEFQGLIKKVDGHKVTLVKGAGFGTPKGDPITLTAVDNVKVTKGKFDQEAKKMNYSPVEDGLKNELFAKGDINARFTVNDKNNITEIRLGGGGGGFKKKDKSE